MNTINNPDASIGEQCSMFRTVCSHKVVAVGFNTLCYDAERRGIKPSARIKLQIFLDKADDFTLFLLARSICVFHES